jgi:hypothetical protein
LEEDEEDKNPDGLRRTYSGSGLIKHRTKKVEYKDRHKKCS